MIDELPPIQVQAIHRPALSLLEQFQNTPTGFLVDAMGAGLPHQPGDRASICFLRGRLDLPHRPSGQPRAGSCPATRSAW